MQFSLVEQRTRMGWLNNKPIYQKTVQLSLGNANVQVSTFISNEIEHIVKYEGMIHQNLEGKTGYGFPMPYIGDAGGGVTSALSYSCNILFDYTTNSVLVRPFTNRPGYVAFVTVWYTKKDSEI